MGRRATAVGLILVASGCAAPSPRAPAPESAGDKQASYGDPTLLPTREGERVRMEVALAREIEQALDVLPGVLHSRVDVELPRPGAREPERVLAVAEVSAETDVSAARAATESIVRAVVGPAASAEVVIATAADDEPPSEPRPSMMLLLAILGLGLSGGIAIERARGLQRASRLRLRR